MTATDKANELIVKVLIKFERITLIEAKKIVLMTVDEIINSNPHSNPLNTDVHSTMSYWHNVKQEIEKL